MNGSRGGAYLLEVKGVVTFVCVLKQQYEIPLRLGK